MAWDALEEVLLDIEIILNEEVINLDRRRN